MDGQSSDTKLVASSTSQDIEKSKEQSEPEGVWQIRDCEVYYDEYDECTSFKGRFHQYFIFGETLDCNQWKKDYDNCCKWMKNKDIKAANAVIESERARRKERFKAHYGNTVWQKRSSPPKDWNKPLPEWIQKRDENSYLDHRAKELKEGKVEPEKTSFCVII